MASAHVLALLECGISVLAEGPFGHDDLVACMRAARRTGASFQLASVLDRTPAAERFAAEASALRPIRGATVACAMSDLHAVLALLSRALGGLRPWRFPSARAGTLAGVPLVLRLHDSPQPSLITLDHDGGELTFHGVHESSAGPPADAAEMQHMLALAQVHQAIVGAPVEASLEMPGEEETHDAALRSVTAPELASLPVALGQLEAISLRALSELLLQCGALAEHGAVRREEEILSALKAAPRHAWLVRRWLAALVQAGVLSRAREPEGYRWQRTLRDAGAPEDMRAAYVALAFPPEMAELHITALRELPRLVSDQVTLPRLLPGALSAYQNNVFTAYLDAACAHLARRRVELRPGPLRVLELGAGEGGTTAAVLRALEGTAFEATVTDVAAAHVASAERRFGSKVRCRTLDINADFAAQGIAPETADLVIAGNVLHNAVHTDRTLRRIRRVLAPGGWLVFTDSTHENGAMLSAILFLLSGPPGTEPLGAQDRRAATGSVFVDADGWQAALDAAGFVPRFVLPRSSSPLAVAGQRLFFATTS